MKTVSRASLMRWSCIIVTVLIAGSMRREATASDSWNFAVALSLMVFIAIVYRLGIRISVGRVTLVPIAALMTYLSLGREPAIVIVVVGLIMGSILETILAIVLDEKRYVSSLKQSEEYLWPLARNGISLFLADGTYRLFEYDIPLQQITLDNLLGLVVVTFIYLIVYNALMMLHLRLARIDILETLTRHRQIILAYQLLPIMLPPFGALTLWNIGGIGYYLFEILLVTIALVVSRLITLHDSLQQQVAQLSSFTSMSRALRTTLKLDPLLENVFIQARNLLNTQNIQIVLRDYANPSRWDMPYIVLKGRRVFSDQPGKLDDLMRWVLESQQALLGTPLESVVQEVRARDVPDSVRTWMGVPLIASNRIIGGVFTWLEPGEQPERLFVDSDLEIFISIAGQASVALENAVLYNQAQDHARQLSRLNRISAELNSSLDPERVLDLVVRSVVDVTGCDKAILYLVDDTVDDPLAITQVRSYGFNPEHRVRSDEYTVPISQAERIQVIRDRRPRIVPSLKSDSETPSEMLRVAQLENIESYVYVPLHVHHSVGLLGIYYKNPHEYIESELDILLNFANQSALAIANARVYERQDIELARSVSQVKELAEIAQEMGATLELEKIFELIVDSAMDSCQADSIVLVLTQDPHLGHLDPKSTLNMVAWRGFDPTLDGRAPHHVVNSLQEAGALQDKNTQITVLDSTASVRARSQLSVPILLEERVIGAIVLETLRTGDAFPETDVEFVSQLAIHAAVAIRNAQLYTRAQMARDRLDAILDTSNDGLLMFDEKSRIVMTNRSMSQFWDFARNDFEARSADQLVADPLTVVGEGLGYKSGELRGLLQQGIANPDMDDRSDMYIVRTPDGGGQRYVERTASPVRDDYGNFVGLLLLFRDVTQEKELEQAREELTRMMVHDLRGPLTAVMTSLGLIDKAMKEPNAIIQKATHTSARAVKKLLNLVNDLLDLSRMSEGKISIDPSIGDIKPMLTSVGEELSPLAQELLVNIKIEVPDDLREAMYDRNMIERVVLNLVDNALKYADQGKEVRLTAEYTENDFIRINIIDRGPGIPDDYKGIIFDRFKQIPGRKGNRASTGIGLAFCKLAVEAHGGKIWVEDNPDGGSIFSLTVPRFTGSPEADDEALERAHGAGKESH